MLANYPEELEKICVLRGLQLPLPFMVTLVCIPFADYDNFPFFLSSQFHFASETYAKMTPERFFSVIFSSEISFSEISSLEISSSDISSSETSEAFEKTMQNLTSF